MALKTSIPLSVIIVAMALIGYAAAGGWYMLQLSSKMSAVWVGANIAGIASLLCAGAWSRFLLYALNGCALLLVASYFFMLLFFYPEPTYLMTLAIVAMVLVAFSIWSGRAVRNYLKLSLRA